jgi:hypothetical protein
MGRHWCVIARLIESKVENGHFDYYSVQKWMGHQSVKNTMGYGDPAITYYETYPKRWYSLALKRYNLGGKRDIPDRNGNKRLSGTATPVVEDGPARAFAGLRECVFLTYFDAKKSLENLQRILSLFFFYSVYKTLIKNIRVNVRFAAHASPNLLFAALAVHMRGGEMVLILCLYIDNTPFLPPSSTFIPMGVC